jgi:4-amino-4-deoxy-L-arabinose transferase-like glycosyltransferase
MAPGYPWLLSQADTWLDNPNLIVRWAQCALGALTAGLYFLFCRRAFRNDAVAVLAGLLCAIHPFWLINTAEINDGVLATFLLAACLFLGTRGAQEGFILTSLLYGLALGALALVRAALLPFVIVGLLWFLWECRTLRRGWLCALLAFFGFVDVVAPWGVRNYRTLKEIIPVADSAFLHLYEGNNAQATGGPLDERALEESLPAGRLQALRDEPSEPRRYNMLAQNVVNNVRDDPTGTVRLRLWALQYFVFGEAWYGRGQESPSSHWKALRSGPLPDWLSDNLALIIEASLLVMVLFGLLGWRWTFAWRRQARLATLACLWLPLPYILGHAEHLWGPRLPLDGVLLCFTAFALIRFVPVLGQGLSQGPVAEPVRVTTGPPPIRRR